MKKFQNKGSQFSEKRGNSRGYSRDNGQRGQSSRGFKGNRFNRDGENDRYSDRDNRSSREEGNSYRNNFEGSDRRGGGERRFNSDRREGGNFRREGGERRFNSDRREGGNFRREGGERRFNSDRREGGNFRREGGERRFNSDRREGGNFRREGGERRFNSDRREGGNFRREGGERRFNSDRREGGNFNREGGERRFNSDRREGGNFRREGGERRFNSDRREGGNFNREGGERRFNSDRREGGNFRREGGERRFNSDRREGGKFRKEGGYRKPGMNKGYGDKSFSRRTGQFAGQKAMKYQQPEKISEEGVRLNKYLANSGVCSRREADELIQAGAVSINGEVVTVLGTRVKPNDKVNYGGETLNPEVRQYILLNKPKGFITTVDDPYERKTVMSLVEHACDERIYPVGRLDRLTTGLLLFTNDGDLAKKLTHPSNNVSKIYHVVLNKAVTKADLEKMTQGFVLDDGFIRVDRASHVADVPSRKEVGVELHSGRNRIVRRIFENLGYKVEKLDRVSFAGLTKKDVPRGKFRHLKPQEVTFLKHMKN